MHFAVPGALSPAVRACSEAQASLSGLPTQTVGEMEVPFKKGSGSLKARPRRFPEPRLRPPGESREAGGQAQDVDWRIASWGDSVPRRRLSTKVTKAEGKAAKARKPALGVSGRPAISSGQEVRACDTGAPEKFPSPVEVMSLQPSVS